MYMYVNICAQTHSQLRIHKQKYTNSVSVVEKQKTLPAAWLCSGSSCSMAVPAAQPCPSPAPHGLYTPRGSRGAAHLAEVFGTAVARARTGDEAGLAVTEGNGDMGLVRCVTSC